MNVNILKHLDVILLVEDEEDHARLIMNSLKREGKLLNEIIWVKNGVEALEYMDKSMKSEQADKEKPRLILLDIKLPLKDGFEVLKILKTDETYRKIPVVMLTTTSNSDDVKKALSLGANDYIVKPVKFSDFVEKVSKLGNYWILTSDAENGIFEK